MVFVFFKAKFQLAVCNDNANQGKYSFFCDITRRDEKQEALHKLNNLMRHGDFYDVICLPPQGEGTLAGTRPLCRSWWILSKEAASTGRYRSF